MATPSNSWEEFYQENPPPHYYERTKQDFMNFVSKHSEEGTLIVLVTSGGTTVPLEHNTVRFVDNFSAGTRGSTSAEHFLSHGYGVIFLYRQKSLEPFARHFPANSLLRHLQIVHDEQGKTQIQVIPDRVGSLLPILQRNQAANESGRLLMTTFETLPEYLHLLRAAAQAMGPLGQRALLYLAAAVSDFYVSPANMSTHKIHSSYGPLRLTLDLVPKILQPLVRQWVPKAFVVSFKLETDENILIEKARAALECYGHQMVVANELHSRKTKVILVERDGSHHSLELSDAEQRQNVEIEAKIVSEIFQRHSRYLQEPTSN